MALCLGTLRGSAAACTITPPSDAVNGSTIGHRIGSADTVFDFAAWSISSDCVGSTLTYSLSPTADNYILLDSPNRRVTISTSDIALHSTSQDFTISATSEEAGEDGTGYTFKVNLGDCDSALLSSPTLSAISVITEAVASSTFEDAGDDSGLAFTLMTCGTRSFSVIDNESDQNVVSWLSLDRVLPDQHFYRVSASPGSDETTPLGTYNYKLKVDPVDYSSGSTVTIYVDLTVTVVDTVDCASEVVESMAFTGAQSHVYDSSLGQIVPTM